MDEITYDNVFDMEEFKNKKKIELNNQIRRRLEELGSRIAESRGGSLNSDVNRTREVKEKYINNFSSIPKEWFIFTPKDKISNDLPRLTTGELSRILFTGCTTAVIYNQDFPEKGLMPPHTIFGSDNDDDHLPPAC